MPNQPGPQGDPPGRSAPGGHRRGWLVLALALAAVITGLWASRFRGGAEADSPHPAGERSEPAGLAAQVHQFCGKACHAYPPPDIFPRRHWRAEVERAYGFFERSNLPLEAPPLDAVVRYYEDRAPEELAVPAWEPATGRLPCRFERRYPGQYLPDAYAISNVNLVRLPEPGKRPSAGAPGPLDILACDMRAGLVLMLRPHEAAPRWKVLASRSANPAAPSNPARAEVVDLDGDGLLDVLVADLGSVPPTDRLCGGVVWLRGRPDGSFTPIPLLQNVGRVADVRAADFRGTGKLDLVVAVFGWQETGEVVLLENHT
ncbi:MAG: VCBS repeat-containing protein, partial [Gemmataceae bacterium]